MTARSGHHRRPISAISPRIGAFLAIAVAGAVALFLRLAGAAPPLVFVLSGAAIGGLAWVTGLATEQLGVSTGPRVSGVLNVAFGNAAEIVITIFALRAGLSTLIKASLTGSILSNMLLVLGASILCGGLKHGEQRFSRSVASLNASMLTIAVIGLIVPAVFVQSLPAPNQSSVIHLSTGIAVVLLLTYLLSLVFFFRTPAAAGATVQRAEAAGWSVKHSLIVLAVAAIALTVLSEVLVDAVQPTLRTWHLSEAFVGLILIPILGNAAEHLISVQFALRNDIEFSMVVSLGSSLQVALFVAPLLVFISHIAGTPLDLVFTPLEIVTVGLAAVIVTLIAVDGRSNWLEGAQLIAVYLIVALAFWFYP